MFKKTMLAIALSISFFSSNSFAAETLDITNAFQIPAELKGCKIYRLQSDRNSFGIATFLFLTKCGNNTSTELSGKYPTRNTLIEDTEQKINNSDVIELNGSQYIKESNVKNSKEIINFNGETYIKIK